MAQTNYTPIILYNSGTTTNAPSASNLASGELAINYTDGKLFYKDNSSAIQVIGWKTTPTTAGGTGLTSYTAGDLPYYASGSTLSKLGIGTSGYVLQSNGSAPTWVAQSTLSVGTATNATNTAITDNTSSSATWYPTIVSATTGNLPQTTSSTKLSFVPSTGTLTATSHAGAWAGSTIGTTYGGTGLTSFTANGVVYASSTSALTTGSGLIFDGNNLGIGVTPFADTGYKSVQINGTTTGAEINLSLNGTVYGQIVSNATNGLVLNASQNTPMVFYTAGSERTRIDTSGNLLVAQTSSGVININGISLTGTSGSQAINHVNGTGSGSVYMYYGYNGATIGSITQNGTTGVLFNLTSDYRLKNNQEDLTGAKDFIMALKPKKWQWWDGSGEGVGFVAHEFMEVAKYSGHGEKDAVDADGKPVYQSIQPSSSEVMANLVSYIQELSAQVTALQAKVGV